MAVGTGMQGGGGQLPYFANNSKKYMCVYSSENY